MLSFGEELGSAIFVEVGLVQFLVQSNAFLVSKGSLVYVGSVVNDHVVPTCCSRKQSVLWQVLVPPHWKSVYIICISKQSHARIGEPPLLP